MNVLVTGTATPFAERLLPRLLDHPGVELVVGIDREQADFEHERFAQVLIDARSPQIARVLRGLDVVIHLAAELAEADPVASVVGTQNLCALAHAAGTRHLIHLSSALVYDNRSAPRTSAINERHARGTPSGCAPIEALRSIEDWLDGFENQHPEIRLVRLRPHWMLGPHSDSLVAKLLRGRLRLKLPEPPPPIQCVHEDDVVLAILKALDADAGGAFNLATKEVTSLAALHRQTRWLRLPGGPGLIARRLDRPAACLELLHYPLVLDSRRARSELGWKPQRDTASAATRR
jgi:nucleoside-diphosphate-sugar epimerase